MKRARPPKKARARVPQRRRGEREARIAWILDAALDIAVDQGIGAVTITRLAERLGYTVGAFYRYFPSLEALLAELHRHTAIAFYGAFFERLAAARAELATSTEARTPRRRALIELALLPNIYRALADDKPRHMELVHQLLVRPAPWIDAPAQRALDALVIPHVVELVSVMARAGDTGAISAGDPTVRMMTLWAAVHATLAVGALARNHPELMNRDRLFDEAVRTLFLGWGARGADVDVACDVVARLATVRRGKVGVS